MIEIDDRFKMWMRSRLNDKVYAEKVMKALIENDDSTLLKVHAHSYLPIRSEDDPEALIGMIKGHDNTKDKDFVLAIFGDWEKFSAISHSYLYHIWSMYKPEISGDFESLPDVWLAGFIKRDSEHPIFNIRWQGKTDDGEYIDEDPFNFEKTNLVNYSLDSDIMRLITGHDAAEDENFTRKR